VKFAPTAIPDVILVMPVVYQDPRGFFMETWRADRFAAAGIRAEFVQDAHSKSQRGVLRGLHYQIEQTQGKLVRAVAGAIFDVAVDLRRSSPTFGRWVGETLTAENRHALWIPPGFAHGFYVLEDAEIVYKMTAFYAREHERVLRWNDPEVGIRWPLHDGGPPTVNARDAAAPGLLEAPCFV
jgi:dTDP-4-dehydrorhamnose 3,5-epimerase